MDDRQSLYPGRVELTDVETGQRKKYDMVMADEPLVVGTPPNKANLLTDETELAIFGGLNNRNVDQALKGLLAKITLIMGNQSSVSVTVQDQQGTPVAGVVVDDLYDETGLQVTTDGAGKASGYVSEGQVTIGVSGYADFADVSTSFSAVKGASYTKQLVVAARNYLDVMSTSKIKFSNNVSSVDITVLAAGGGGAFSHSTRYFGFGGGAGGECVVREKLSFEPHVEYDAIVGAGGSPGASEGSNGANGGNSSFLGVSAKGGAGGTEGSDYNWGGSHVYGGVGNGNGGYGYQISDDGGCRLVNPTEGSVQGYSSFTGTVTYGGGGQGGYLDYGSGRLYPQLTGSTAYGGSNRRDMNGQDGFGAGGAGSCEASFAPGRGGHGRIAIRMHLKTA